MPIINPQFNTLDYGRAKLTGQRIQENRIRNQMLGTAQQEQQNVLMNREKARKIREQVDGIPAQIEAMEGQGMFDQADKLRQTYVGIRTNEYALTKAARGSLNADNYQEWRSNMVRSGAMTGDMLPTEYSDDWFASEMKTRKGKITHFIRKFEKDGGTWSQSVQTQDGEEIWKGAPFQDAAEAGDKNALSTADSNAIRKANAQFLGGKHHPATDEYLGLTKGTPREASQLSAAAEEILIRARQDGQQMGINGAVLLAQQELLRTRELKPGQTRQTMPPLNTNRMDPMGVATWQDDPNAPPPPPATLPDLTRSFP